MADSVLLAGAAARIQFTIGAAGFAAGPITMACIVKRAATGDYDTLCGDWLSFNTRIAIADDNTVFSTYDGSDDFGGGNPATSAGTSWQFVGVTKATGSVVPTYHLYDGSSWVHDAGSTAVANGSALAAWQVSENGGDAMAGNILIFGVDNTVFTNGQMEALTDYPAWVAAGFTEGVRCDAVSGLASFTGGSMAQTSATGASLDTGDVPSWWSDDEPEPPPTYDPVLIGHTTGGRW